MGQLEAIEMLTSPLNYSATPSENSTSNLTNHNNENDMFNLQIVGILVPLIWGVLTIVGALGNALVIYTLIRHGDKNATNYFVINLAISDFAFVIIVVPFTASLYIVPAWVFGDSMCKITMYMIYVTLHATCLTLMAMTVDRYCAIVHAIKSRDWRTTTASMVVCLVVWFVSFLISLPFAIYFRTTRVDGNEHCVDEWPEPSMVYSKSSIIAVVITTYVVPLTVIVFCYARILNTLWKNKHSLVKSDRNGIKSKKAQQQDKRRKRVTKLVASVVIVFATFWLPIHIVNLWFKLDINFPRTEVMYYIKILCHSLSYANSCVNPVVYAYLSDGFRKAFRQTFPSIVNRYRICGWINEESVSQVAMTEKPTEQTKAVTSSLTTINAEERHLMQTDL